MSLCVYYGCANISLPLDTGRDGHLHHSRSRTFTRKRDAKQDGRTDSNQSLVGIAQLMIGSENATDFQH